MQTITRQELREKQENDEDFALVNVLSEEQFAEEHIPDSINIPLDRIAEAADWFEEDEEIVVYCASESCQASPKAAKRLKEMGFENVMDYEGGLQDWKDAGLETRPG